MTEPKRHPFTLETLAESALAVIQQRTSWTRQQAEMLLGVLALSGAILVCGLSVAVGSALSQPPVPTATPTVVPYPVRSAEEVMAQLKRLAVPVSAVQAVPMPNATWQAS